MSIKQSAGMSLLETMIAMAVVSIGLLGIVSSIISTLTLTNANHEEALAMNYARRQMSALEALQSKANFSTIFANYNHVTTKLDQSTDANQNLSQGVVTVYFPTDSTGTKLVETPGSFDPNPVLMGVPSSGLDLNNDGRIDGASTDHSGDYKLLPVTVRVTWMSSEGARVLDLHNLLVQLKP